jgi:hypothetical protein
LTVIHCIANPPIDQVQRFLGTIAKLFCHQRYELSNIAELCIVNKQLSAR